MHKINTRQDPDNPNVVEVSGEGIGEVKEFLKANYKPSYNRDSEGWVINRDQQQIFDLDEKRLFEQLRAKMIDREVQREFENRLSKNSSEDNKLLYGKSILVYIEKANIEQMRKSLQELSVMRSEAKKAGVNLDPEQEMRYSYLESTLMAADIMIKAGVLRVGKESKVAYFENWKDREALTIELNSTRKETMYREQLEKQKDAKAEEADEEEVESQRR